MTSIYTRTGDTGETSLFGGGRVEKSDPRVDAYGDVDELNAVLGVARSEGLGDLDAFAADLQAQLFTVGAVLATPAGSKAAQAVAPVRSEWISAMEATIDRLETELRPLQSFILPGGSKAACALHLARTVCRRAERKVVPLTRDWKVDVKVVEFLNRLSDLLFVMARAMNHRAGVEDVLWTAPKR